MFASSSSWSFCQVLVGCGIGLLVLPDPIHAVEATLSVEVAGGKWKAVRLKNLPEGAPVALQIESSNALRVIMVDSVELKRFPKTRALFTGSVEKRLGFSVVIPRAGDYFIVLDNRTANDARQVTIRIKAQPPPKQPSSGDKKLEET